MMQLYGITTLAHPASFSQKEVPDLQGKIKMMETEGSAFPNPFLLTFPLAIRLLDLAFTFHECKGKSISPVEAAHLVMEEKYIVLHPSHVWPANCLRMVLEVRVHVPHETRDLRSHAVLHGEGGVRQAIVDQTFEERQVEMVVMTQLVHGG